MEFMEKPVSFGVSLERCFNPVESSHATTLLRNRATDFFPASQLACKSASLQDANQVGSLACGLPGPPTLWLVSLPTDDLR